MKRISAFFLVVFFVPAGLYAATLRFQCLGSTFEIIDSADAAPLLVKNDVYTSKFSVFDVQSRLEDTNKRTEEDYLLLAEKQPLNWTEAEQQQMKKSFQQVEQFMTDNNLSMTLPPVVHVIKSTCKEEFYASAYTRSNNIVFNAGTPFTDKGLTAHELFHVFSRYDEQKRNVLYAAFGFKRCNPIDLSPFHNLNITNPDCPVLSHYITVNGADFCIVLYSKMPYSGGNVFESYIQIGFIMLEGDGNHKKIKLVNGKPIIHQISEIPDIFKQVGNNTSYLLHPEELLADHFKLLVTRTRVQDPVYLERMKVILTKN